MTLVRAIALAIGDLISRHPDEYTHLLSLCRAELEWEIES